MADRSRDLSLTAATVLMIISFGKVGPTHGKCLTSPINTVVYEGTENTVLRCGLGPNGEKWTARPTSNPVREYMITNFTGSVSSTLTGLYAVNQSGLIIRNATIDPTGGPISTAGLYVVYFADGNRTALKLVVIRSGPTCSLTQSAFNAVSITCSIIYTDHPVAQINATISCTADGQVYSAPPNKTFIKAYLWNSTTVITINNSFAATYDCRAGFTAPVDNTTPYLARNEPTFTANVAVTRGQCLNYLENIVVYEGTKNTILRCGLGSNGERWTVRPTSQAQREFQITNFTGSVSPNSTGLYAVNQSGLIIRNATIDTTATDPISTAGVYYVYVADGNRTAAKIVVIRSGPTCSWTRWASGETNITCTIIYADFPIAQMNATISCTADGRVYTGPPNKTLIKLYLWDSTTVITISNSSAATYDCRATFTAPEDNNRNPYLAKNEPTFTANVTVGPTYKKCLASAINTVVYEGTENTILSCGLGPNGEKWTVRPTSDAVREYQITNFTGSVSPTLTGLYAINQSGLVIRNATIDPTGGSISTAGLYYVYFADGNKNALKLVVIRSGPSCCWTQSASSTVSITCTVNRSYMQITQSLQ